MMDTTTTCTKSHCSESLSSLHGMLKRERMSYDAKFAPSITDSDYPVLRRSLIEVFDEVFDLCRLQNRDTVAVAVSYLDTFMATQQRRFVNVQIAAMTCFYLAVKLYEPTVIPPAMICELFQRTLHCDEDDEEDVDDDESTVTEASAESVESMEMTVLSALKWNLNPPTSMMFVRQLLDCLPSSHLADWKQAAMELSRAHLEVGMKSQELTKYRASTQAVAALFVATEKLPVVHRGSVFKFLLQAMHLTAPKDQREVLVVQALLKRLVAEAIDEPSSQELEPVTNKRTVSYEATAYDERPTKKQRSSSSSSSFTSSPRSILFPIDYALSA